MSNKTILTFKHVMLNGHEALELTSFENITKASKLPYDYINSAPYYYADEDKESFTTKFYTNTTSTRICIGKKFSPSNYEEFINNLKMCGSRLNEIRRDEKERAEKWLGQTVTVEI